MFSFDLIAQTWDSFFHQPESPLSISLFRILWASLLLFSGIMYYRERQLWFGPEGMMRLKFHQRVYSKTRFSLLVHLPQTEGSVTLVYLIYLVTSFSLLIGFLTNISAFIAFFCLASLHNRNPLSIYGGDDVLRIVCFFLAFSNGGMMFSVDAWLFDYPTNPMASPWCTRWIQLFVSILYLKATLWKLGGELWRNGTAVHYPLYVNIYQRYPLPAIMLSSGGIKAMTYGTLLVEFSLASLIWVEELRYPVLAVGVLLHLGMEYTMNLQLFEWKMIFLLAIFLPPDLIFSL